LKAVDLVAIEACPCRRMVQESSLQTKWDKKIETR